MVEEKKVTLNGIKKIFPGTKFIKMNIQVVEKPKVEEYKRDL